MFRESEHFNLHVIVSQNPPVEDISLISVQSIRSDVGMSGVV